MKDSTFFVVITPINVDHYATEKSQAAKNNHQMASLHAFYCKFGGILLC